MGGDQLNANGIFDALNHEVRREILLELCNAPDQQRDLTEMVASIADRQDVSEPPEMIGMRCYHSHLPKLHAAGLVDYNWDAGEVEYNGAFPADELRGMIDHEW